MDKTVDKLEPLNSDSSTLSTNVPVTFGKLRRLFYDLQFSHLLNGVKGG